MQTGTVFLAIMLKFIACSLLVSITTVVHYSCGQCTTKYCEEGEKGVIEQNNYLLQEIKRIGEEVRKIGEEVKVIKAEVQSSRDEINKSREETKKIGEEVRKIGEEARKNGEEVKKNGEEVRKNGEDVRKNGKEVTVIKDKVQSSRDEINKTREEMKKVGEEVRKSADITENIALSCGSSTPSASGVCTNDSYLIQSNSNWKHCGDVYKAGYNQSGVYRLKPTSSPRPVKVYCDHSNGGGWTVFQRRIDGRVLFNRTWKGYKHGFGDLQTEHWLGNDLLAKMTASPVMTLRVDLMDFNGTTAYEEYKDFKVRTEFYNYTLEIGTYSGTAGDRGKGMSYHKNMQFSTIDRDDSKWSRNCATNVAYGDGGWWYSQDCGYVNLNGYYKHHIPAGSGTRAYIVWWPWKGWENLQRTTMRFRPSNF